VHTGGAQQGRQEPRSGSLDLHEGIGDPRTGCKRWPEHLWLLSSRGEAVQGRCRATNLCRYCQQLYVVETLEMLSLDAAENAPTLWVVLTAREHLTRADCRGHLRQLRKVARARWPDAEWFVQVEFQRRGALHLNLLVKGVPVEDDAELLGVLSDRWCDRVDALPVGQHVERIADAGGVTRYLQKTLAHGLKQEQAPPIGWRGHRTSQTRGYLVRPASVMRQEAREALRDKREIWRAIGRGEEGVDVELSVAAAAELRRDTTWRLHSTQGTAKQDWRSIPEPPQAPPPAPNVWLRQVQRWDYFVGELWHAIELEAGSPPAHAHASGGSVTAAREGQKRRAQAGP
jgi:hypothetical protein